MSQPASCRASRRAIATTIVFGAAILGISWGIASPSAASVVPLLVFAAMVFIAEWLPVPIGDDGVQVSASLPILAAVAALYGPAAAGTLDASATLIAGICFLGLSKLRGKWLWAVFNGAQAAISASSAGLAAIAVVRGLGDPWGPLAGAMVATLVYLVVNSAIVAMIESILTGTPLRARLEEKRRVVGFQYLLYAVLAVAVVALTMNKMLWACGLFFVPMWAARKCFQLRSRYEKDYRETIRALGLMMQHAHPYTGGHLDRVARYAAQTAQRLGLSASEVDLMFDAALLHDLGKIAVDEDILNKPGRLNADEWAEVRKHPAIGADILSRVAMLEPVVPWIAKHHERPDGTGYPFGLKDEEIPVPAKIIAVVDAYDAMVGGDSPGDRRPYRISVAENEALRELHACSGTQFDERVVMAFAQVIREQQIA